MSSHHHPNSGDALPEGVLTLEVLCYKVCLWGLAWRLPLHVLILMLTRVLVLEEPEVTRLEDLEALEESPTEKRRFGTSCVSIGFAISSGARTGPRLQVTLHAYLIRAVLGLHEGVMCAYTRI